MRIATLNTWARKGPYEERFPLILKELNRIKPDIICLQEVFDEELPKQIKLAMQYLYSYESFPAGLVIISKFPIRKSKTLTYDYLSSIDDNDRRAIFSEISVNNRAILVGNTHWPWKPEDDKVRFKNAKELLYYLKSVPHPIFLAGDFNTSSESDAISILKESGFQDLFLIQNPDTDGFTWDNTRNPYLQTHSVNFPDRRIDLVLGKNYENRFQMKRAELVFSESDNAGTFPSDHFGVLVELVMLNEVKHLQKGGFDARGGHSSTW